MINWAAAKRFFEHDGALRDLYAFETSLSDWQRFLDWVRRAGLPYSFTSNGQAATLPETTDLVFGLAKTQGVLLVLHAPFGEVNCHFFLTHEIELDLQPADVQSAHQFQQLLEFIEDLAAAIGKAVTLTYENMPDAGLLTYDPLARVHHAISFEDL